MRKLIPLFIAVFLLICSAGCATTSVLIMDESKQYPPSKYVPILNAQPTEDYIVIAQLETRGPVGTSLPQILGSMRDEAKAIGADAIIPTEDVSEYQQPGVIYNPWLGGYQSLPSGKLPVIRGLAIKYKKNLSTLSQPRSYKPRIGIGIGFETFGLPYYSGFSGGAIWLGKNHFKIRAGKTSIATPSVYLRDGFENDNFTLTIFNIEYFMKSNYRGPWFGMGIGSFKGTIGHENESELGSYEYASLGINVGYQYKLLTHLYINGWGGIYAYITGDTDVPVGNRTVYFDEGIPFISLDIGLHF